MVTYPCQTWDQLYEAWRATCEKFGFAYDKLFTEFVVYDPAYPTDRPTEPRWAHRTNDLQKRHLKFQRALNHFPGVLHPQPWSAGDNVTLLELWDHRNSPEQTAAILMLAAVFTEAGMGRKCYGRPELIAIRDLCWQIAEPHWHPNSTSALPTGGLASFVEETLFRQGIRGEGRSKQAFHRWSDRLEWIVRFYLDFFSRFMPIALVYEPAPVPEIAAILATEQEQQDRMHERWRQERLEQEAAAAAFKAAHPRHGEWHSLPTEELTRLVWSKSVTDIATEFGVSDVAIGKRCKREGIAKPPRGFWAKVHAGKIPHPGGKPIA